MVKRKRLELSVQARLCDGGRSYMIGDLIPYHFSLWIVQGLFISGTRSGQPELYYILSEASSSFDQLEDIEGTVR